jgi:hypothetical protein
MSTASTIPLFGRSWDLQVLSAPGNGEQQVLLDLSSSALEPAALRVTFDINMTASRALWTGDISIYNLDPRTIGLITQGAEVILSAGYQAEGQPTEIWRGIVFQPTFERVDVVDFVLTLHCFTGLKEIVQNFVNTAAGPIETQWSIVKKAAQSAGINIAYLDPESSFTGQKLPRGKTIFGSPDRLFGQIATQNDMVTFYSAQGLNMGKAKAASTAPDIIYAPPLPQGQQPASNEASISRRLVGSPQQTDFGASFRVLLDPRLQIKLPLMQVQIDQAIIQQQTKDLGSTPSILTQDGIYLVAGVRHYGDSRGNEWNSDVIGVGSVGALLALVEGNK